MSQPASIPSVRRRRVFYIPGFDPYPPRRYRELYRRESASQSAVSGYDIAIAGKHGTKNYGWRVAAKIDGQTAVSDVEVLLWSDLVRQSMSATLLSTYWQMLRTSWIYLSTGTLRRLMWMRKGPVIAALYPVGALIAQLVCSILLGALFARVLEWAIGVPVGWLGYNFSLPSVVWWALVIVVAVWLLHRFQDLDHRFYARYLMLDYAFSARENGAYSDLLETRLGEFSRCISDALKSDVDEVLVVGHSSGAHLAVSVLSDLLRDGGHQGAHAKLGLLSLGQVIPMVSFLPKATRLRADLQFLSEQDDITWVDVSAPGDGCSFALCDPVAVTGVATTLQKWPLVLSAAFTQTLSEEFRHANRWRFFRLHFQYLCAFDRPGDYDYFQITAGPLSLGDRFKGRKPSNSRIDVPASKYTSLS